MNVFIMTVFFTRKSSAPMTAAERQRRCRANGKGRHRSHRPTRAQVKAYAAELLRRLEEGADPATAAAAASAAAAAVAAQIASSKMTTTATTQSPQPSPEPASQPAPPAPASAAGGGQIVAN
jgi:hypothetical protein